MQLSTKLDEYCEKFVQNIPRENFDTNILQTLLEKSKNFKAVQIDNKIDVVLEYSQILLEELNKKRSVEQLLKNENVVVSELKDCINKKDKELSNLLAEKNYCAKKIETLETGIYFWFITINTRGGEIISTH